MPLWIETGTRIIADRKIVATIVNVVARTDESDYRSFSRHLYSETKKRIVPVS